MVKIEIFGLVRKYLKGAFLTLLKMKILFLLFISVFLCLEGYSQEAPIHNQHFMNHYVYNPAFVGHDERAVVYLSHRRQWMGIEGAPVSSNLSFHTQLTKSIAVGANIYTETRGLLTSSTAELALAYKVKIGNEHYVQFGLGGGLNSNTIDLDLNYSGAIPLEPEDNSMVPEARFGIKYHIKNLNIGLALPALLKKDFIPTSAVAEQEETTPFDQYSAMISYKFQISENNFAFEPHLLYRTLGNDFTQIEATGIFHIKELVWVGATYRMDYGINGLAGLKIRELLTLGYAYELASGQVAGYMAGSHEIQLSIKLGKKKNFDKKPQVDRPRFDTGRQ